MALWGGGFHLPIFITFFSKEKGERVTAIYPFFLKCFSTEIGLIGTGMFLRRYVEEKMGQIDWEEGRKTLYEDIRAKEPFLWTLLYLERIMGNIAITGFIIGIPIYLIWRI